MTSLPVRLVAIAAIATLGCGGSDDKPADSTTTNPNLEKFSFFVLSLAGAQTIAGSPDGLGGDFRQGETGAGAGLRGADKICSKAAEAAMPGAGKKAWRAFLSVAAGPSGGPVHAKDRVGTGPWHDARGRQVASSLTELLKDRPGDADLAIKNDLPNEHGVPNGSDGTNNHAVLTGSGPDGTLYMGGTDVAASTCNDWTSKEASGAPWCGHSWPRGNSGSNWISAIGVGGCAPCVTSGTGCVGSTGGYGGIYCFVTNAP